MFSNVYCIRYVVVTAGRKSPFVIYSSVAYSKNMQPARLSFVLPFSLCFDWLFLIILNIHMIYTLIIQIVNYAKLFRLPPTKCGMHCLIMSFQHHLSTCSSTSERPFCTSDLSVVSASGPWSSLKFDWLIGRSVGRALT